MVWMCLVSENEVMYVPRHATVYNPAPDLDEALKIMLASAGFPSVDLVREFGPKVTTSVVTEPPIVQDTRAHAALPVTYDMDILRALASHARVDIGSLTRTFPSTKWLVDGGGQFVRFGQLALERGLIKPSPAPADAITTPDLNRTQRHGNGVRPRMHIYLGVVPDVFSDGLSRFSRRISRVDGVALRNGDTVRDVDGVEWYFNDGLLSDRVRCSVLSKAVRTVEDAKAIASRRAGVPSPPSYVPSAKCELRIIWPASDGGGVSAFACTSFPEDGAAGRAWGWWLDPQYATVEHPRGLCQGEHGVALDRATPELCVKDGGTWDRPCERDTECPFYDVRRGRGGCSKGGFCEMPLGVDRRSFRSPGSVGRIMNHGCAPEDPNFPWCPASSAKDVRFGTRKLT